MANDLKARLDAMVALRAHDWDLVKGSESGRWMRIYEAVALDLLAKLDAQDKVIAANNMEGLRGLMEWALEKAKAADAAEAQVESLKLETKALTAERDELKNAAWKAERWLWDPDENQLDQFERIADEFYAATGHLRPGKDDSFEDTSSPENRKRWQDWSHGRNREVLALLRAALKLGGE